VSKTSTPAITPSGQAENKNSASVTGQQSAAAATTTPQAVLNPVATQALITINDKTALQQIFQSPDAWSQMKTAYEVLDLGKKLYSLTPSQIIQTLQNLGIGDTTTLHDLQIQLSEKTGADFVIKNVSNFIFDRVYDKLTTDGLRIPKPVFDSIRDTLVNAATLDVKGQIVDQTVAVVNEYASLNRESSSLVYNFIKQGSDDLALMQQAIQLRSSGVPADMERANKLQTVISSALSTTQVVADQLSNGSIWPPQIDIANRWAVIQKIIDARYSQMQHHDALAASQIEIAKSLAKQMDGNNALLNILNLNLKNTTVYQDFATQVANSYGVAGW
jgi:hypothetical protein